MKAKATKAKAEANTATAATGRKFVAYYRVSTERQGQSGLGLEAQQASVQAFIRQDDTLLAEYIEVESGKKNNRPELAKAIEHAKSDNCVLLIAKLDRLSRNAAFTMSLRDSGTRFIACDMPDANELTINILAVVAQDEADRISKRTKAALEAKRARGDKLGNAHNLTDEHRALGRAAHSENARTNKANRDAMELAVLYHDKGMNLQQIADKLNSNGHATRFQRVFRPETIRRLLKRAEA